MNKALGLCILFLNLGCSGFYYHPHKQIYLTPTKLNKYYEQIPIKTPDGEILQSWLIKESKQTKSKNLIIQFHGNAENMSTHFTSLAWLTKFDFDLLTFDYRGYGESTGVPTPLGVRTDAIAFFNMIKKRFNSKNSKYEKIIFYGQSIGGIILMDALRFIENKNDIDLLVLDSTFTSYKKLGLDVLQKNWITYLFSPLAYLILDNETSPENELDNFKMKKLIIHATKDPVVSFEQGQKLYQIIPDPKDFWEIPSSGHISTFFHESLYLRKKFIDYIHKLNKNDG